MKKNAVTAAPTSTTNMTGLRACVRGLSLAKESPIARSTIWRSKSGRAFGRRSKRRLGRRCPLTGGSGRGCVIMLECLSLLQKQMLDDRSERVGRKERERADDDNRADQQGNEDRRMRCERADSGRDGFFPGERTGKCECRNGDSEAPEKHVHSGGHIPEEVRPQSGKGAAVIRVGRRKRVQHFRKSMYGVVSERRKSVRSYHRDGRRHETKHRRNKYCENRELHLATFDFLAEKLRRSSDHEAGDENRQHDEQQHSVETAAHTAEDDLAELH